MYVDRPGLLGFLSRLDAAFTGAGQLYLIGETSLVLEGWRGWSERIEFVSEVDPRHRETLATVLAALGAELEVEIVDEFPGDVIPLPEGWEARARPVNLGRGALKLCHFDPYSVSFRFIARGDEPDYHLVLSYLRHGWITVERMNALLEGLLPRFTQRTIQQDPAEFRRKYHGLLQMARAVRPFEVHRTTPA